MTSLQRARAHAAWELRLLLRNGEQLLLSFVIPIGLLIVIAKVSSLDAAVPAVLTTSLLATSFTSLAIATAFERRSGALAYLGTTPLDRSELILGKFAATATMAVLSALVSICAALLMGWQPTENLAAMLVALLLGGAAFTPWAVLLAGTVRAEAVLAIANGIFIVLLMAGGIVFPISSMPLPWSAVISVLPTAALAEALSAASWPWAQDVILVAWALIGALIARRSFRWQ